MTEPTSPPLPTALSQHNILELAGNGGVLIRSADAPEPRRRVVRALRLLPS